MRVNGDEIKVLEVLMINNRRRSREDVVNLSEEGFSILFIKFTFQFSQQLIKPLNLFRLDADLVAYLAQSKQGVREGHTQI